MACIIPRGKSFSVVYTVDGRQKWETCKTEIEANKRKEEIESNIKAGTFVPPPDIPNSPCPLTVEEFLEEYVEIYGETKWSHSTYTNNTGLIHNYINPIIGKWKMDGINTKKMDSFFTRLKSYPAVARKGRGASEFISDRNIYDINLLLSNAFDKAVDWEYAGKNPITRNSCPDRENKPREMWDPDTAKSALTVCKDLNLLACMHLAIACSMRIGEITGLRWEFVSLGDIDNNFEDAVLKIDAQLQRIKKEAYEKLKRKKGHIKFVFPSCKDNSSSMLVLKTLKSKSSERVIWIPPTTTKVLYKIKMQQDEMKSVLGSEYEDYDLVITQCNGDVKSVQGETGHSQAKMVTDTYAHILDGNRLANEKTTVNKNPNAIKR